MTSRLDWLPPPPDAPTPDAPPHADALPRLSADIRPALPSPLECAPLPPIGPANLPPRPWAYGRFLLFGTAAVLGAVDGGGKGAIAVAMALAMITGRPLLDERIWRSGPVAIVTYEDDEIEWHRRFAAACVHFDLDYERVIPQVHFIRRQGGRVRFASMGADAPVFPDGDGIIEILESINAAMLIVDPFNHAHDLGDGNNNAMMAQVAGEISRIARESNCAALVLHHLRKGSTGAADDLMGATALRATFRAARILARMAPEVATKMQITDPWRYVRIAASKENYAPPPDRATWFRLVPVPLHNPAGPYLEGDDVAVATTWEPPALFDGVTAAALRRVFTALRETVHGAHRQGKHLPWAGRPLIDLADRTEQQAAGTVNEWLKNGVLIKAPHYVKERNNSVESVVLNDEKVAAILTEIDAVHAPAE